MVKQTDLKATIRAVQDAVQVKHGKHDCLLFDRFFSPAMSGRVLEFFKRAPTQDWKKVPLQEELPRRSIEHSEHPTYDEMNVLFRDLRLIMAMEERLGRRLKFFGVSFWKDLPGYQLPLHVDNQAFNCAIQIYVGAQEALQLGTSLSFGKEKDVHFTLPFRHNTGYFLLSANKTLHGLLTPVPKAFERYSIYARYSYR